MSKSSKNRFNGLPSSAAYAHSKTFITRTRHLLCKDFFVQELFKAIAEKDIAIIVHGQPVSAEDIAFVEVQKEKPPTYEELLAFYKEHKEE